MLVGSVYGLLSIHLSVIHHTPLYSAGTKRNAKNTKNVRLSSQFVHDLGLTFKRQDDHSL